MPSSRNGSEINQTIGHSTSANSAIGQQSKKSNSQPTNARKDMSPPRKPQWLSPYRATSGAATAPSVAGVPAPLRLGSCSEIEGHGGRTGTTVVPASPTLGALKFATWLAAEM